MEKSFLFLTSANMCKLKDGHTARDTDIVVCALFPIILHMLIFVCERPFDFEYITLTSLVLMHAIGIKVVCAATSLTL